MRKIKEVLRLRLNWAWGCERSLAVARLALEPPTSICNEPKQPASVGRLARIGMKIGLRLPYLAVRREFAQPCYRCPTLPSFIDNGSSMHM